MIARLRRALGDAALRRGWLRLGARLDVYCDEPGCRRRAVSAGAWGKQWCEHHAPGLHD